MRIYADTLLICTADALLTKLKVLDYALVWKSACSNSMNLSEV